MCLSSFLSLPRLFFVAGCSLCLFGIAAPVSHPSLAREGLSRMVEKSPAVPMQVPIGIVHGHTVDAGVHPTFVRVGYEEGKSAGHGNFFARSSLSASTFSVNVQS